MVHKNAEKTITSIMLDIHNYILNNTDIKRQLKMKLFILYNLIKKQ